MFEQTVFQTIVVLFGALSTSAAALFYFRRVRLERPAVGVEQSRVVHEDGQALGSRGGDVEAVGVEEEVDSARNVLAGGTRQRVEDHRRLLALEENSRTNDRLRRAGFDVHTFPGSELCINGSGGPTCKPV